MSQVPHAQSTFNFWEFVHCARCYLPFSVEPGVQPQVPFWLTECGHVICNNHISPDQSCAQCGEAGVQVMPLQRDMEPPMSDWFRPAAQVMDSVAHAAKFQQDAMASLIGYYRTKCYQQKALLDRMKGEIVENKALRKAVEELKHENEQLRRYSGYGNEPSQVLNGNGKRQMIDPDRHPDTLRTNSSPRTIVTPVGPGRLTLPPSHLQPSFSFGRASEIRSDPAVPCEAKQQMSRAGERPGSSRFLRQYAYSANDVAMQPPVLTHWQTAPTRQVQIRSSQVLHAQSHDQGENWKSMPPPYQSSSQKRCKPSVRSPGRNQMHMPPPPTPQGHSNYGLPINRQPSTSGPSQQSSSAAPRFVPPTPNRSIPLTPRTNQRFVPSTPSGQNALPNPPGYYSAMRQGSAAPSRAPGPLPRQGSNQRMPFLPGSRSQQGFG